MRKDIETILHGIIGSVTILQCYGYYYRWSFLALLATFEAGVMLVLSILYLDLKQRIMVEKNLKKVKSFSTEVPVKDEKVQQEVIRSSFKPDKYIENYDKLKDRLLELADEVKEPAGNGPDAKWNLVLERKLGNYTCRVEKRVGGDFFFRISCDFESSAEEAFDYLSDIEGRSRWDELTEQSGFIERASHKSSILYMHSKGVWPTAPRDCLVMSFISRLHDGRFCNVTQSIENHPNYQPRTGSVRMTARLAGLIIGPHASKNPKMCHCIQIVDGDLGGWLPPSIVALISTQAFPLSMGRVNDYLSNVQNPRTTSKLIEASEGKETSPLLPMKEPLTIVQPPQITFFTKMMHILKESQPVLIVIILMLMFRIRR